MKTTFRFSALVAPIVLALLVVCGAVLRLGPLVYRDYKEDELFTISFATDLRSIPEQILFPVDDRPPLFYLFVKVLLFISNDRVALRFPSLLFSLSCIPISYLFFRKWSKVLAFLTATLFAFSPFYIEYGWQLRDYGALIPITLTSVFFLFLALEEYLQKSTVNKRNIFLFAGINTLGLLTNYIYFFFVLSLLASLTLLLFFYQKKKSKKILTLVWLAHLLPLAITLQYLLRQKNIILMTTGWIPPYSSEGMERLLVAVSGVGFTFDESYVVSPIWAKAVSYVMVAVYGISIWITWTQRKYLPKILKFWAVMGPMVFLVSLGFVIGTSVIIDRSLFLPRTFLPAAVVLTLSQSIFLFTLLKYCLRKSFVLVPLLLVTLGFMSFCYWDSYADRQSFLFFDDRKERFQSYTQVIEVLQKEEVEKSQLVFLPIHYQKLFTSAYFPNEKEEISRLAVRLASTKEFSAEFTSGSFFIVASKLVLQEDTNYYSREYIDLNQDILKILTSVCRTQLATLFSNEEFEVYKCDSAAATAENSSLVFPNPEGR